MIVCGVFLRFWALEARQISSDEAFSWRVTQFRFPEMLPVFENDANPPLYYILLKVWTSCFGQTVLSMRALSGLLGCFTLIGVYVFAEAVCNPTKPSPDTPKGFAGTLAAALVAFSAFHLLH